MRTLEALALSILAVFAPIKSVVIASLVLITLDMVTGILAARKQGVPITSKALKRSISKLFLYEIAILMSFVTEQYLLSGEVPVLKMITAFIGLTELKSVLENIEIINGNKIFSALIEKLAQSNTSKLE